MARLPRYFFPNQPQHLIQRGNNRSAIFTGAADYRFFLSSLQTASARHGCRVHAYVLMTNHVHLLVSPEAETSIPRLMQSVGTRYAKYFNWRYARTGTLWEGRYRATLIDTDAYLLTCYRYVELNPVRAGMVCEPGAYRWSSYRWHAHGVPDPLITDHFLYQGLGGTGEERRMRYREFVGTAVQEGELEQIRDATNNSWVLGRDPFKRVVERALGRRTGRLPLGRPRK
ncbi:MAG: transposase [Gammaproteobacteria bacterium]|nr:transposase [Gammaproteobacteria bacterium]NIR90055.1 transposase [Gammaproteobacteria bacterium]NIU03259.1 transposase [Gammaproteobacteria bacterium]NIV50753.1 transposase [Gammaproteobacteria bacterium]NIV75339.1 transposase [Gammaproteobacteria bacterium]